MTDTTAAEMRMKRIERLIRELADAQAALDYREGGAGDMWRYWSDKAQDVAERNARLISERDKARAEVERLRAALAPFAEIQFGIGEDGPAEWFVHDGDILMVEDFKRARAALNGDDK